MVYCLRKPIAQRNFNVAVITFYIKAIKNKLIVF